MKKLIIAIATTLMLPSCVIITSSYYQPPPTALEAWQKEGGTLASKRADLESCQYIDNVTKISRAKFQQQTQCMKDKGYTISTKPYNPHNCYGQAPAMCALVR